MLNPKDLILLKWNSRERLAAVVFGRKKLANVSLSVYCLIELAMLHQQFLINDFRKSIRYFTI